MPRSVLEMISGTAEQEELIRRWFAGDAEGVRRLEFYADPAMWFSLLSASRRGWLVSNDGQPVGFIDMELSGDAGYIAYYIAPEFRGRGHGSATVRLLVEQARDLGLRQLDGGVEPDNAASIAALRRVGFVVGELDDEGMLPVTLTL